MATVRQLKIVIDASAAEEGAKRVVQAEQAMERATDEAADALKDLDKAQEEAKTSADALKTSEQQATQATKDLGTAVDKAEAETKTFVDTQGRARDATGRYVTTTKQAAGVTNELGQAQDRTVRSSLGLGRAFAGITAGLSGIALIRTATRELVELGNVQAKLRIVTGDDPLGFETLARQAESFRTRSTAAVTAAQLEIARAGYSTNEVLKILPPTLDLVTAAEIGTAEAAQIVSNTLGQFGLAASDAAGVVDSLVLTADRSTTNVQELAEALKIVGPVAASLKVPLNELLGLLGAVSKTARGGEAGTGARGVIASLLDPSAEGARVLKELGLTVDDVSPSVVGLTNALQLLRERGLSDTQAVQLFRREAFTIGTVLTNVTAAARGLTNELNTNQGITQKYGEALDSTLGGSLREIQAEFAKLIDTAGDKGVTGAFRGLVGVGTDILRVMRGGTTESKGLDAALNGLLVTVSTIVGLRFAATLVGWAVGLRGVTVATTAANGAAVILNRTLLLNPWTAAIAGAAGLVAILVELGSQSKLTNEQLEEMANRTSRLSSSSLRGLQAALPSGLNIGGDQFSEGTERSLRIVRGSLASIIPAAGKSFGGKQLESVVPIGEFKALAVQVRTLYEQLQQEADPAAKALAESIRTKFVEEIKSSGLREDLQAEFGKLFSGVGAEVPVNLVPVAPQEAARDKAREMLDALREELSLAGATNQERAYAEAITKAATVAIEQYGFATDEANRFLEEYGDTLDQITAIERQSVEQKALAVDAERRLSEAREGQRGLIEILRGLEQEEALIGATNEEKRIAAELTKAAALAEVAFGGNVKATADFLAEYEERLRGIAGAYEAAAKAKRTSELDRDIGELAARRGDLGLSAEEQRIREQVRAFNTRSVEAFGDDADGAAAATARFEAELRALTEAEKEWARIQEIADGTANQLGGAIDGLVDSLLEGRDAFTSIQDAAAGFVREIAKGVFSTLVTKPLVENVSEGLRGLLGDTFGPDGGNPAGGIKASQAIQATTVTVTAASVTVGGGVAGGGGGGLGFGGDGGPGIPSLPGGGGGVPGLSSGNGLVFPGSDDAKALGATGSAPGAPGSLLSTGQGLSDLSSLTGLLTAAGGAGALIGGFSAVKSKESGAGKALGGLTAVGGLLTLLGFIPGLQFLIPIGLGLSAVGGIGGSFASARGNVFRGQEVVPFADGGIVSQPTTFPLSGSRIGLAGEAGPEAIVPLKRGKDGTLGVAGGVTNVSNTYYVTTPDAASFRKAKTQIMADAETDARRAAARR
jgi:TP901 family phage tail tape measure protein